MITWGMDLLQTDIQSHLNEFMHLSLSKVSQWHSKHAFQLWSHHDHHHLARKEPNSSLKNLQNACAEENKSLKIWKVHVQLCGIIEIIACAFFNRQIDVVYKIDLYIWQHYHDLKLQF